MLDVDDPEVGRSVTGAYLIHFGFISDKTAYFLDACVRGRLNIIVSGSTGAYVTNVLSSFISMMSASSAGRGRAPSSSRTTWSF